VTLCSHLLLVVLLATTACAPAEADRVDTRSTAEAIAVLRAWDHRRAQAWAAGDEAALAGLYTPGSRTGRHDRAMLVAYAARGLRVSGLRTQVLEATLLSRAPGRVRLELVDRMVGAYAVGPGGRIVLPRDRPSERVVSLRRVSGSWLVEEVTDAGSAS
jgi:hypothetical protein